ncbi:MAG: tetratricopeptide repeat protein [Candidatus Arsenophonus melophagi]|nr:tetratricopeptide repeat protein [Candidatus Arsenophonus melophagi]
METYTIQNKQRYVIKYLFIKKKILLAGLLIGVSIVSGLHYWQLYQANNLQKSAQAFEKISSQLQANTKQALTAAELFVNEANNIYGILINIELAKIFVEKDDFIAAEKTLFKALAIANVDELKNLLNIKLARIQLALKKPDQALITLEKVKSKGWYTITKNIRGDILLNKGDIDGARFAYSQGIESSGTETMKTILKLKINSLPN